MKRATATGLFLRHLQGVPVEGAPKGGYDHSYLMSSGPGPKTMPRRVEVTRASTRGRDHTPSPRAHGRGRLFSPRNATARGRGH